MNHPGASALVHLGIPALALFVAALFVLGAGASARSDGPWASRWAALRAAAYVIGLLGITGAIAAGGALADVTRRPPPFIVMMVAVVAGTVLVSRSALGRTMATKLPWWVLVGSQAFRLPLELVMHRATGDGVMPTQMSFGGYNFDIVTGATALILGVVLYVGRAPRAVVFVWNVLGSVLLAVIVGISVVSSPLIQAFGPEHVNDFVLYFPYVWLPTVLVPAALFGHLAVFRRLKGISEINPRKILGSHSPDSTLLHDRA